MTLGMMLTRKYKEGCISSGSLLYKIIDFTAKNWRNNENEHATYEDTFKNQGKIFTMTNRKEILFEKPLKMSQHISFPLGHTCRNMDTLYAAAPTP